MHPWSALPMLRSAEPRVFFVWGASNELLKWVENGQFGGPKWTQYIYIYIWPHIYICCEVIIWSKFGVFKCYYLVQVGVFKCYYLVQVCFLTYKNSGFKRFGLHTQLSFCVFFLCPIIWQFSKNSLFQKKGAKIGFFNFQCFKYKIWKFSFFGLLKHYKNRGFSIVLCFLLLREKKTGKKKNDNWNLWN